jgi:hypothetical protein
VFPVKVTNDFLWELGQTNFQRYRDLNNWIDQNIHHTFTEVYPGNLSQVPYRLFHFHREEDAVTFVLTWL